MKFLLLTTALIFAGKAQSDNYWICGSDDDPRSCHSNSARISRSAILI